MSDVCHILEKTGMELSTTVFLMCMMELPLKQQEDLVRKEKARNRRVHVTSVEKMGHYLNERDSE